MALDRFFLLKCVVLFYVYVAAILGVLMILGSIVIILEGKVIDGLQSIISGVVFIAWAFLGYYGVTKKQRTHLLVFAVYLVVSFVISLIILAILPSNTGEISSNLQLVLLDKFGIQGDYMLHIFKILLIVEAVWKIFTSVCAFWLVHLIRIEERHVSMGQVYKG